MDDEKKLRDLFSTKPNGFMFSLERSTLTLLSLLVADKEVQTLYCKYDLSHMEFMHNEIKESMIIELLIEISTKYRMMSWGTKGERPKEYKDENVGVLIVDGKETELSMYEACNKIIHANKFEFDVNQVNESKERVFFKPYIHTYGTRGKENWTVMIDIILFCNASNQLLETPFGIEF